MDRRQNNRSVKAVSPCHCPATCALRNCCFNCCAWTESQRQCPLHCCSWTTWTTQSNRGPTCSAQLHLPTHDLFWATLNVQLHLPPLRSLLEPWRSAPYHSTYVVYWWVPEDFTSKCKNNQHYYCGCDSLGKKKKWHCVSWGEFVLKQFQLCQHWTKQNKNKS